MKILLRASVGVGIVSLATGCAQECDDDGLVQQECAIGSETDGDDGDTFGEFTTGESTSSASDSDSDSDSVTRGSDSLSGTTSGTSDSTSATATDTGGDTDSRTGTDTAVSATATDEGTASGSTTAIGSTSDATSGSTSDTMGSTGQSTSGTGSTGAGSSTGGMLWCVDGDGDGFGDPDQCVQSDRPVDGSVPNGEDCDDEDEDTFPGAAEAESETACMNDDDGDGWGDDSPPAGVEAGTDCADDNPDAHPQAAANESDPTACMIDLDSDGWADASPGDGITPGSDCWDFNAELNPPAVTLATVRNQLPNDEVQRVDETNAELETMAPLDTALMAFDVTSTALRADGTVFGANGDDETLYLLEYELVCVGILTLGEVTPLPNPHGLGGVCGITFGAGAQLYAIDNVNDELVQLDASTGEAGTAVPLSLDGADLDVGNCGMAWDCTQERLLLANQLDGDIYEIDPMTGALTVLADTDLVAAPSGLEYDPVSQEAFLASFQTLARVALDGSNTVNIIGMFDDGLGSAEVSNLAYLPACDP